MFFASSEYQIGNQKFCFRFTWLGPNFNNESEFRNATCDHLLNGVSGIPCQLPLTVTGDRIIPIFLERTIIFFWRNFFRQITAVYQTQRTCGNTTRAIHSILHADWPAEMFVSNILIPLITKVGKKYF